ncbi:hypothetical protein BH10PSE17_BH10PSE17_35650 [soil metagenome]
MASTPAAILCALVGVLLWTGVGWLLMRRLRLGSALSVSFAPALGWAVQTVIALALSRWFGLTLATMLAAAVIAAAAALLLSRPSRAAPDTPTLSPWIYLLAALVALAPALAVVPKVSDGGVQLAAPIFDHSKIALTDQMIREGVPPANPVVATEDATPDTAVSYYYLWHFGAAQLARLTGSTGWEADIASTWFTAFASLCLMAGLSLQLARRRIAPLLVLLACLTGSLRPVLAGLLGSQTLDRLVEPATGLAGWLFQTSWSPHHVAAATCTVLATVLMAQLARRASVLCTFTLALVLAAAFQSSIWVGGILFAIAGTAVFVALWLRAVREKRLSFTLAGATAGVVAAGLAWPLILAQLHTSVSRASRWPITVMPEYVLGPFLPETVRRVLDVPAYWIVLLVIELPIVFVAGVFALRRAVHADRTDPTGVGLGMPLAVLAATSLCGGWLLASTAGVNNDLGWRSVLPAILTLTAAAAAGVSHWLAHADRHRALLACMAVLTACAAVDGASLIGRNAIGQPSPSALAFMESPAMWAAVRAHARPDQRVASNPWLFNDITPWPVNISWALLADRRSCFAGNELAIAFAPLSTEHREAVAARFARVFDGKATDADATELAERFDCSVALVTARDGAWLADPFAASASWRIVETRPDQWRIYLKVP